MTHMRILSVVRIEVFSIYEYDYMKKIILSKYRQGTRRFSLLLSTYGSGIWLSEKRVEDFQLGIESYQTQLNLTKPRWEATCLEFMH
ncbi:hypothetical protein Tco_0577168, partial [Tanacetum coccineum]